jgi:4-amino-4-deoxy-L-arabinose transferase-like glycosyltransferase
MVTTKMLIGIAILIIVLIAILVWSFVIDDMTKMNLIRSFVCSISFWIPFGALGLALTQGCASIPV